MQVLDRQNVGYIGPTEIREILKNLEPSLSPVEVEEIVREVDLERNGKIDINGEKWRNRRRICITFYILSSFIFNKLLKVVLNMKLYYIFLFLDFVKALTSDGVKTGWHLTFGFSSASHRICLDTDRTIVRYKYFEKFQAVWLKYQM